MKYSTMKGLYGAVTGATDEVSDLPSSSAAKDAGIPPSSLLAQDTQDEERQFSLASVRTAEETSNGGRNAAGGVFGRGSRREDNSRFVTTLLVLNYMIGSGILNSPQTFRDGGLAATTIIYFVACE